MPKLSDIIERMEVLRQQGWLVVLKCIPDGFPWIVDEELNLTSCRRWVCEASWAKHDGSKFRGPQPIAISDTANAALTLVERTISDMVDVDDA